MIRQKSLIAKVRLTPLYFGKAFDTPPHELLKIICLAMKLEENNEMDRCFSVLQPTESFGKSDI